MSAKFPRGGGEQTHSQPSVYFDKFHLCSNVQISMLKSFCRAKLSVTSGQINFTN